MSRLRAVAVAVLSGALALQTIACSTSRSVEVTDSIRREALSPAGGLALMIGQSWRGADGLTLRLRSLDNDSRCPQGVQCVWQGDVAARLTIEMGGRASDTTVHTALEPRKLVLDTLAISIDSVSPQAVPGQTIPQDAYKVFLHLERAR
jgi:hypothetical protein